MATEKHEPAYPNPGEMWNGNKVSGLTKREYFAALAMPMMIPGDNVQMKKEDWINEPKRVAEWSVKFADALIEELNK